MIIDIYKPPDKHDPARFTKEMLFFSYIAHEVAEQENVNEYSVTRFTKIAANYVQDWVGVLGGLRNYLPYMGLKPNPYGMVAAIPKPMDKERARCIYEFKSFAKKNKLWDIREDGYYKQVVMLSDPNNLRDRLLKTDETTKFDLGFTEQQLEVAYFLSELYSKFKTSELNILASHRNKVNSKDCLRYAFRVWETNYQEIIPNLASPAMPLTSGDVRDMRDKILKMTVSCEQIELKTGYTFYGIQDVIGKLENISDQFVRYERATIKTMVAQIRKESQFSIGSASIDEQYLLNREYLYPITEALIYVFNMNSYGNLISERQKQVKYMREVLDRPTIIESDDNPVEIRCSEETIKILQNVGCFHQEADKRGGRLLIPFRKSDEKSPLGKRRDEFVDWVVTDGREERDAY